MSDDDDSTRDGTHVLNYVTAVMNDMVPMRWCRFCKAETRQLISPKKESDRACTVCWRRQKDGSMLAIADGERVSQRAERPSTTPPPPPTGLREYALKSDVEDVRRMIEELRAQVRALEESTTAIASRTENHTLYK